ncbi:transcription factor MYB10-like [Cajanus cajan]|uniref:transcription factor MYB10-like n=1 Tax=Cajanus cajan TaxID=3821 RepID=UPI00098DADAE|nr:transcription factor MYB10-like [Cajanus cajan]
MANSQAASESMDSESRRRVHHWKETEDDKLRQLVQQHGPKEWNTIAEHMEERTGKSCRLRWVNHLDPKLNRNPFTKEEEERLLAAREFFGARWAMIAKIFPGRTDNFVKNRWHVTVARKRKEEFRRRIMQEHNNRSRASSSRDNNASLAKPQPQELPLFGPRNELGRGALMMRQEKAHATLCPNSWLSPSNFGSVPSFAETNFPLVGPYLSVQRVNAVPEHFGLLRDARINGNFGGLFGNSSSSSAFTKFRASSSSEKGKAREESSDSGGKEITFFDFLGVGDQ